MPANTLDRRTVLVALAGLAAAPGALAQPLIDPAGARAVGQAYLDAHPGQRFDAARLKADLLPEGWNDAAAARLRARAQRDFRQNRVFVHRGWRLSETEGRLFALAALAPT